MDVSTQTVVGQVAQDPQVMLALSAAIMAALKLAALAVAALAGRLLNTKLKVENSTWKQKIAYRLVCYAENKIADDKDKQAYVARSLSSLLGKRVEVDEIDHLIEEAVVKLQATTQGVGQ